MPRVPKKTKAKKCNFQKNILTNLCFGFSIVFFYIFLKSKGDIDKALCLCCVAVCLVNVYGLYFCKQDIIDYGHHMFGVVIFTIPFVTNNMWILGADALMVAITLVTRSKYVFGQCMFNSVGKTSGFSKVPSEHCDYYFSALFLALILKMVYISTRTNKVQ